MHIRKFQQQHAFQNFLENDPEVHEHAELEAAIMARRSQEQHFLLDGYCKVCDKPTMFLVDKLYGGQETTQGWMPNWRERLTCVHCQLNNRQRAMVHAVKTALRGRNGQNLSLYAMEQVTPLFQWLKHHLSQVTCVGSEYLGENIASGTIKDGIIKEMRHEDVEALSFAEASFDVIMSNDVLEHVNQPIKATTEMYRVLKPGGEIFVTIPFHLHTLYTVRRAEISNGQLQHLLPPLYHGNPISSDGSLVFSDFGWDFLESLHKAGFHDVSLCHYWSYSYGYLGDPQYYFWAYKPD